MLVHRYRAYWETKMDELYILGVDLDRKSPGLAARISSVAMRIDTCLAVEKENSCHILFDRDELNALRDAGVQL